MQGVAFMVDNCSYTARLGSRKWAPRFDYMLEQQACNYLDANKGINSAMYATLLATSPHGLGARASERERASLYATLVRISQDVLGRGLKAQGLASFDVL